MKSDDKNVVPLCFKHHHILHTQYGNELNFFQEQMGDLDYGKKLARELYEQSEWARESKVI